jgi:NADH-quinone oxidoreductase subunit C
MTTALKDLGELLSAALPNDVIGYEVNRVGELSLDVRAGSIVKVLTHLRDDPSC